MRTFKHTLNLAETLADKLKVPKYKRTVILGKEGGPQVAILPFLAGRLWGCTTQGSKGSDITYHNEIAAKQGDSGDEHFPGNFGGLDRVWFASEVANCFAPGVATIPTNWYAKREFDFAPYYIHTQSQDKVTLRIDKHLEWNNYYGNKIEIDLMRRINLIENPLLSNEQLSRHFERGEMRYVGYQVATSLTNCGKKPFSINNVNLISIWILAQFNPMKKTYWIASERDGSISELGPQFIDYKFGIDNAPIAKERRFRRKHYFIKPVDGEVREKWGIPLNRFMDSVGYIDLDEGELFVMQYYPFRPEEFRILQQSWTDAPKNVEEYAEKVFHPLKPIADGYNDGPVIIGKKSMGGFFEVELLGNAEDLRVNNAMGLHYTAHRIQGPVELLLKAAQHKEIFGVYILNEPLFK